MPSMQVLTAIIGGFIRHMITTYGGVLITNGVISESDISLATGAIATLIGIGWSVYKKLQENKEKKNP